MLFPTVEFAVFFVVVFAIAWMLHARPSRWKAFMLLASAGFYASWNVRYLPLLALLAIGNGVAARQIHGASSSRVAKRWLTFAVVGDLATLVAFKYLGFFMAIVADALSLAGVAHSIRPVQLTLPLGVSFVAFQSMSLAIDAYRARDRQELEAPPPIADVLLYVSFFPHLVAGPIVRAKEFLSQIGAIAVPTAEQRTRAIVLISGGLAKKVVLATYLGRAVVDPVFAAPEASSAPEILAAIYGYAVQIYADFSGYTDMAIGLAALLGVTFPQNFRQPYRAQSLREFWRRWHMTLSRWLRDYLFISLGGSRDGRARTMRNLFITMLLGGLWHGAAWTFVLWGCLHGGGLVIERWLAPDEDASRALASRVARTVITFHVVCLGWVLFRASSVRDAWTLIARLARWRSSVSGAIAPVTPLVVSAVLAGLLLHFLPESWPDQLSRRLSRWPSWALGVACGALLALLDVLSPPGIAPFIYFQF